MSRSLQSAKCPSIPLYETPCLKPQSAPWGGRAQLLDKMEAACPSTAQKAEHESLAPAVSCPASAYVKAKEKTKLVMKAAWSEADDKAMQAFASPPAEHVSNAFMVASEAGSGVNAVSRNDAEVFSGFKVTNLVHSQASESQKGNRNIRKKAAASLSDVNQQIEEHMKLLLLDQASLPSMTEDCSTIQPREQTSGLEARTLSEGGQTNANISQQKDFTNDNHATEGLIQHGHGHSTQQRALIPSLSTVFLSPPPTSSEPALQMGNICAPSVSPLPLIPRAPIVRASCAPGGGRRVKPEAIRPDTRQPEEPGMAHMPLSAVEKVETDTLTCPQRSVTNWCEILTPKDTNASSDCWKDPSSLESRILLEELLSRYAPADDSHRN